MADEKKLEQRLSENSLTLLFGILGIAMIAVVCVVGVYWYYFNGQPVAINPEPWGQFGDFIGGTLNPIFGFLSVIALLGALVIQSRELKISSEELKKSAEALDAQHKAITHQSFEQTFFSWLESYRELLKSINQSKPEHQGGGIATGRDAMYIWWANDLQASTVAYRFYSAFNGRDSRVISPAEVYRTNPIELTEMAISGWNHLYDANEYQLDSLFRTLYRLIHWIDTQNETRISNHQKWFYVSIIRAQLSWIEMVYLFYNGYTERGKNFKRLVEKYALFDNLNIKSDQLLEHLSKYPPSGQEKYSDHSYDSSLARVNSDMKISTQLNEKEMP